MCNWHSEEVPVRLILGVDAESGVQQAEAARRARREMATSHGFEPFCEVALRQPIVYGEERNEFLNC